MTNSEWALERQYERFSASAEKTPGIGPASPRVGACSRCSGAVYRLELGWFKCDRDHYLTETQVIFL